MHATDNSAEVEITPAMKRAGARILQDTFDMSPFIGDEIAAAIVAAMDAAKDGETYP
jgi:hypothetical protein